MQGERLVDGLYAQNLQFLFRFWDSEKAHLPKGSLHLSRTRRLLAALDHPERRLAGVAHIAGTNGKGSVAAFLDSLLTAHGLRCFRYTSPHLHSIRERFRVAGEPISKLDFCGALEDLRPELERSRRRGEAPSVFEILTGLALHLAVDTDLAIVETGLGGRCDATNVFADSGVPSCALLSRVGLDHTAILGNTLTEIAADKAHIMTPGGLAISAPQEDEAAQAIAAHAARVGARLLCIEEARDYQLQSEHAEGCQARFLLQSGTWLDARLGLAGSWQVENAALALRAAEQLLSARGLALEPARARAALRAVDWPARCELLETERGRVFRDGAHNPAALRRVLAHIARFQPGARLIFGCGADKDRQAMLRAIDTGPFSELHLTRAAHPRAAPPEELAELCRHPRARAHPDLPAALAACVTPGPPVWVLGSLFLCAELEGALGLPVEADPRDLELEGSPGCRRKQSLALLREVSSEVRVHPYSTRLFGLWTWPGGQLPYAKNHYDLNPITSANLARDKFGTEELLRLGGLPVPGSRMIENPFQTHGQDIPSMLRAALEDFGGRLVCKPNTGSQGSGIGFFEELTPLEQHVAALFQRSIYRPVLLQPCFAWRDIRVLVLRGEVVACYERRSAALHGDGQRTQAELLQALMHRNRRLCKLDGLQQLLEGADAQRVLAAGEQLELSAARSISLGGRRFHVELHKDWKAIACQAAALMRLQLAGVDLLLEDPEAAPDGTNGVVLEVNSSPALNVEDGLSSLQKSRRTLALYRAVVRALLERAAPSAPG